MALPTYPATISMLMVKQDWEATFGAGSLPNPLSMNSPEFRSYAGNPPTNTRISLNQMRPGGFP